MRQFSCLLLLPLLLVSPLHAAIRGVIISRDGVPIPNATISVHAHLTWSEVFARLSGGVAKERLAGTQSDTKGAFSLEAKGRNLQLRIEAAGHAGLGLLVDENEDLGAIALRAAPSSAITVSGGGQPLANAIVMIGTDEFHTTDAEGKVTLPDPRNRAAELRIHHPQYAPLTTSLRQRKSLAFSLEPGVLIEGTVTTSDRKTPVAGAEIRVDGWQLGKSAEDGSFRIANAPKNWRELVAVKDDQIGAANRDPKTAKLTIRVAKGESLSGSVREAASGGAIANAKLQLWQEREPFPQFVVTDAKGSYSFSPLLPGSYQISATAANHVNGQNQAEVRGAARRDFALVKSATILGMVIDENRKGLGAASVSLTNSDGGDAMMMRMRGQGGFVMPTAISAPDGRFVLRNVAPDVKYQVVANRKGFPRGTSDPVDVAAGERKSGVSVMIPNGIEVRGVVRDANERPLSNVVVNSTPSRGDSQFGVVNIFLGGTQSPDADHLRTGPDGSFVVRLKEGTYDFRFSLQGYAPRSINGVKVASSGTDLLAATLVPGVEVSGRVTRAGVGVADATVVTFGGPAGGSEPAVTAPDGSFTLTDLSPGQVSLMVSKLQEGIREERRVTAPARDVAIELPGGGRISGRVIDKSTRAPITSFRAGMSNDRSGGGMVLRMPAAMQQFRSDAGQFTLENVPTRASELIVEAPGYVRRRMGGLTIEEGKPISDLEVEMESGTSINGKVVSSEGTPLAGVIVGLATDDSGPVGLPRDASSSATTDGAGEFTLAAVAPGEQTIVFQKFGFQTERKSVRVSGREQRVDARLSKGRDIVGVVVSEGGAPIAGANVSARTSVQDAMPRSAVTDPNGEFRFSGLTPGRYRFTASKPGLSSGELKDFDIESSTPLRIVIEAGGTISGRITGLNETDLAMARVTFSNGQRSASAVPDSNGNFRIENAPTGTVRVRAEVVGAMTGFRSSPSKTVEVSAGGEANVEIRFDGGATVSGRVTRDGRAVANGSISFMPTGGRADSAASTRIDDRGAYSLSGLTDGTYTVRVIDLDRLAPHTRSYEVRGSSTFDIDIRSGGLRGRVVDASTSAPIADVSISIREITDRDSGPFGGRNVASDAAGTFRVDSISSGRYELRAQKTGYGQQTIETTIQEGSAGEVEFKLQPNDGIALRIVDGRDNRVLAGFVMATDSQGRRAFDGTTRSDASGIFRIPLSAGSYKLRVAVPNYATRTLTLSSPSSNATTVAMTPGGILLLRNDGDALRIRLVSGGGDPFTSTPNNELRIDRGARLIENIPPGSWTVHVLDEAGASRKQIPVNVAEGQTTTVELK